ncbi:MAG: hypothetical protein ABIG93_04640 [archaeon]|nr:hypothetical protein [Nanoarchaeota archaeon]
MSELTTKEKRNLGKYLVGKSIIEKLPDNVRYRGYYGTWAFSHRVEDEAEPRGYKIDDTANDAVRFLAKAHLPEAWEMLGNFCGSVANYEWENRETGCYFNGNGAFDYLVYFGIRAYLLAGEEQKAISLVDKFSHRHLITHSLKNSFATAGTEEPKMKYDSFDLPSLDDFVEFKERVLAID